jgi:DNA polymerase II small subunit
VVFSYEDDPKKVDVQDFVLYYRRRYEKIQQILSQRPELASLLSIMRINEKKERDIVALVGVVSSKQVTKNNNIVLEVEDPTGIIKVIATQKNPDLIEICRDIVLDEVIGITGFNTADNVIFAKNIFLPDVPSNTELKKSPDEAYAIFISDLHVGSKNFLEKDFKRFLN